MPLPILWPKFSSPVLPRMHKILLGAPLQKSWLRTKSGQWLGDDRGSAVDRDRGSVRAGAWGNVWVLRVRWAQYLLLTKTVGFGK